MSMICVETKDNTTCSFASLLCQDIFIILEILGESCSALLIGDVVIGLWEIHTGRGRDSDNASLTQGAPTRLEPQPSSTRKMAQTESSMEEGNHIPQENIPLVQARRRTTTRVSMDRSNRGLQTFDL